MKSKKRIPAKARVSLALYKLMLTNDYENISIKDICKTAKVSRMSFYRNYDKKDDVFIAYCDERFEEFYDDLSKENKEITTEKFIYAMFQYFKKYNRQINVLIKAEKQQLLMEQFNSYSKYLLRSSKLDKLANDRPNPVLAPFISGGFFNVLISWLNAGMQESPEEMTRYILNILRK